MNASDAGNRVSSIIASHRDELVDLCLTMGRMDSPAGNDRHVADYVANWFQSNGLEGWVQLITPTSANAIGRLAGTADGPSLIMNAHIDTGRPLPADASERLRKIHGAWVEGDIIYGVGVVNCKAQVAAMMVAARAFKEAGIRLAGDLTVTAVAFETGSAAVDEHQGMDYPGEGFGSEWLVNCGITADYALIGETSAWSVVAAECGAVRLKITAPGREIHTPRLERGGALGENPNSIVKMSHLVLALEEWAARYEARETRPFARGTFVPKAQIKTIRSTGSSTYIYIDIRLLPDANPRTVEREIRALIRQVGIECKVEPYYWRRGYFAEGADPLIAAVEGAHKAVLGTPLGTPHPEDVSMWRDLNIFNGVGIPSICYGPPRRHETYSDAQNRCMSITDVVLNAQVYARTALAICGLGD